MQIASVFPSESMVQVPWKHRTLWVFSTVSHLLKEITFSFLLPLNQQELPSFSKTVTRMCVYNMQHKTPEQMHKQQLWCYQQETLNTARQVSGKPGKLRGLSSAEGIADNRTSTDNSSPECAWWFSLSSALWTGWTSLSRISEEKGPRSQIMINTTRPGEKNLTHRSVAGWDCFCPVYISLSFIQSYNQGN